MSDTKIKVCGITSPEDAVACHALGVDYLGVIFADSPRRITSERAAEIRHAAPRASLVGVFAKAGLAEIAEIAAHTGLNLIQLHGEESPAFCETLLDETGKPLIKVFRGGSIPEPDRLQEYRMAEFFLFDLDKEEPNRRSAIPILWEKTALAASRGFPIFLAGGLGPDSVRDAIGQAAPFGVDVCSGVEKRPRVKDMDAVRRFVSEARQCPLETE